MLRKIKIEKYVIPKKILEQKTITIQPLTQTVKTVKSGFMLKSILTNFILEIFLKKIAKISQ